MGKETILHNQSPLSFSVSVSRATRHANARSLTPTPSSVNNEREGRQVQLLIFQHQLYTLLTSNHVYS